jgi:hypothetical protein
MKTQKLTFHCDRGHGWLEVPREDIDALGLADQISAYSYAMASTHKRAGMVYLEEDCDASRYLDAAKAAGYTLQIVEKYTDGDSPIRNMAQFSAKVPA